SGARHALPCGLQHAVRPVDPHRFARLQPLVHDARELSGAAPEIDDVLSRFGSDQRQQVVKRLFALALEHVVLARIPRVNNHADPLAYATDGPLGWVGWTDGPGSHAARALPTNLIGPSSYTYGRPIGPTRRDRTGGDPTPVRHPARRDCGR